MPEPCFFGFKESESITVLGKLLFLLKKCIVCWIVHHLILVKMLMRAMYRYIQYIFYKLSIDKYPKSLLELIEKRLKLVLKKKTKQA